MAGEELVGDLPVWGSILDDVWVLRDRDAPGLNAEAATWTREVDAQWRAVGATTHETKKCDDAENTEIQGGFLHSRRHTLGSSPGKTVD